MANDNTLHRTTLTYWYMGAGKHRGMGSIPQGRSRNLFFFGTCQVMDATKNVVHIHFTVLQNWILRTSHFCSPDLVRRVEGLIFYSKVICSLLTSVLNVFMAEAAFAIVCDRPLGRV